MWFLDNIVEYLETARDWFLDAYYEVNGWIIPFRYLAPPLYGLYVVFYYLEYYFDQFNNWLAWAGDRIDEILSSWDIWDLLAVPISWAEDAINWVNNWWNNVQSGINAWWTSTSSTVQGWIDSAVDGFLYLVDQAEAAIASLTTTWDNFWTVTWPALVADLGGLRSSWDSFIATILPDLATWTGVGSLVESTIRIFFPFYDELVAFWGEIQNFFSDPEDYLVRKLESMLERFW